MPKAYCINHNGQYFILDGLHIPQSQFKRCSFYNDQDELYEAVAQLEGLDLDEVEDGEVKIKFYEEFGLWFDISSGRAIDDNEGLDCHQLPVYVSNYQ